MGDPGVYFYAIARGLEPHHLHTATGIGDAPLRLVQEGGLCAVVSAVDLNEFGEEGLRRNLEDLAWLESVAVAHDRVSRLASEHAPTAPLRLATVFLGEDAVRSRLAEWHDSAERALDRIEGRREWSVKAYADPAAAPAPDEPAPAGVGAGKAYLMKRREAAKRREEESRADVEIANEFHAKLDTVSVLSRRLPPQDRRLTMHTGEMILNGTYLVGHEDEAAFKNAVDRLAGQHEHVRVELGGPWPPYSFATLETP